MPVPTSTVSAAMYSFAPDRQPPRASSDVQADGYRQTSRRVHRGESTTPTSDAVPPRDAAVPQADGEP